jgi:hypothetical protein
MEGIFSIRLNKEGIAAARLVAKIFIALAILNVLLATVVVIREVHIYKVYRNMAPVMEAQYGIWAGLLFRVVPIAFFVIAALNLAAVFFTWKFSRQLSASIRSMDENRFSSSFRNLANVGMLGLFIAILQIAIYIVILINQFAYGL